MVDVCYTKEVYRQDCSARVWAELIRAATRRWSVLVGGPQKSVSIIGHPDWFRLAIVELYTFN